MPRIMKKSCESQLLTEPGEPNSRWTIDQLTDYAIAENVAIQQAEQSLSAGYWRLGHALKLIRNQFGHGHWGKFLAKHGIDKSRSSKAIAIYTTFPTVTDLHGKPVNVAYKERKRRPQSGRRKPTPPAAENNASDSETTGRIEILNLRTLFVNMQHDFDRWLDEAAFVEPGEAHELIERLDSIAAALQRTRELLQERALAAS